MMFLEALDLMKDEALNLTAEEASLATGIIMGTIFLVIMVLFIVGIAVYIYSSLAMMAIAKKAKHPHPALVWIPSIGQHLVTSQIAKMPWWPILLSIGCWIPLLFDFEEFTLAILVLWIPALILTIFSTIWMWKTYEAVKRPGYWALLSLIPPVGLVLMGIAAWEKR